tara:strand:- start:2306 stop:2428 length:123 start_codon:yes stop_codon:yes gene_type:complete
MDAASLPSPLQRNKEAVSQKPTADKSKNMIIIMMMISIIE